MKLSVGKVVFGSLFMLLLPFVLSEWAIHTEALIPVPVPFNPVHGLMLLILGVAGMFIAMLQLWFQGKGLPMTAYPPARKVISGLYGVLAHPIYFSAILISFGVSILMQSSSGFWLVSPVFMLMCIVYVAGFEQEQIVKVFGKRSDKLFFHLPEVSEKNPGFKLRFMAAIWVFIPWLAGYELFILAGVPSDAVDSNSVLDTLIPFRSEWVILYSFTYPFALSVPFIIKSERVLRNFMISSWLLTIAGFLSYLTIPFISVQQPVSGHSFFDQWVMFERNKDGVTSSFPAFHVIWALVAGFYYRRSFPALTWFWHLLTVLIIASCLFTEMHSLADVGFGFLLYILIHPYPKTQAVLLTFFEQIANSWKEWRVGQVRVISHGYYAGLAGFTGTLIMSFMLPGSQGYAGFMLGFSAIVGAALWARWIEGSPRLLRPFGYYGSVAGVIICALIMVRWSGLEVWPLLTAASVAAPWVQVIGRFRCLVQGCCHGKPVTSTKGICFHHPLSRVNKISGLSGKELHATQVYSIVSNLVIGLFLFRMLSLEMPGEFITGMYLILNGLARFAEEEYRGEAQTPYWKGMRIYQWIAIASVALGMFLMCIDSGYVVWVRYEPSGWLWALALGLISVFAYGVDFPESNKPFARLTS